MKNPRSLGHVRSFEFRGPTQPTLLRRIAKWIAEEEKKKRLPNFLLTLDLREEDLDDKDSFTATIFLDGP